MMWKLGLGVCVIIVGAIFYVAIPAGPFAADIARSPDAVYANLIDVDMNDLSEAFSSVDAGIVSGTPNSSVVWTIKSEDTIAGQLQIKLEPRDGGKSTHVVAVYAIGDPGLEPELRSSSTLGELLRRAVSARVAALDPKASVAASRDSNEQANKYLTSARISLNMNAVSGDTRQMFSDVNDQLSKAVGPPLVRAPAGLNNIGRSVSQEEQSANGDVQFKPGQPMIDVSRP